VLNGNEIYGLHFLKKLEKLTIKNCSVKMNQSIKKLRKINKYFSVIYGDAFIEY